MQVTPSNSLIDRLVRLGVPRSLLQLPQPRTKTMPAKKVPCQPPNPPANPAIGGNRTDPHSAIRAAILAEQANSSRPREKIIDRGKKYGGFLPGLWINVLPTKIFQPVILWLTAGLVTGVLVGWTDFTSLSSALRCGFLVGFAVSLGFVLHYRFIWPGWRARRRPRRSRGTLRFWHHNHVLKPVPITALQYPIPLWSVVGLVIGILPSAAHWLSISIWLALCFGAITFVSAIWVHRRLIYPGKYGAIWHRHRIRVLTYFWLLLLACSLTFAEQPSVNAVPAHDHVGPSIPQVETDTEQKHSGLALPNVGTRVGLPQHTLTNSLHESKPFLLLIAIQLSGILVMLIMTAVQAALLERKTALMFDLIDPSSLHSDKPQQLAGGPTLALPAVSETSPGDDFGIDISQRWNLGLASVKGQVRDEQQDYCLSLQTTDYTVLIIADGCGGHPRGALASRIACLGAYREAVNRLLLTPIMDDTPQQLALAMLNGGCETLSNEAASQGMDPDGKGLRTTLIIVVANATEYGYAYIGDGGGVVLRTSNTIEQVLIPQKDETMPHVLFASLGPAMHGDAVHGTCPREEGDLLVVGTDGVFDRVDQQFPKQALEHALHDKGNLAKTVDRILDSLVNHQDEYGYVCDDNMTLGLLGTGSKPQLTGDFWLVDAEIDGSSGEDPEVDPGTSRDQETSSHQEEDKRCQSSIPVM